jgi:ferric-dicitrate binding protein FerR (iron transport regulator)
VVPSFAGTGIIGVASAIGSFSLNNTPVTGTANVADGAMLSTNGTTSAVYLQNGSTVNIGTHSAAQVYSDKLVIQAGGARIDNLGSFKVLANGYTIQSTDKSAQVVARISGDQLQVASLSGAVNVYGSNGVLLKTLSSGAGVAFEGQSGASAPDCTNKPNQKGCPGYVPPGSGAGGGTPLTDKGALLIALGLLGVGLGVGLGLGLSGGGTPTPTSPI